jgi:hypothetical protein
VQNDLTRKPEHLTGSQIQRGAYLNTGASSTLASHDSSRTRLQEATTPALILTGTHPRGRTGERRASSTRPPRTWPRSDGCTGCETRERFRESSRLGARPKSPKTGPSESSAVCCFTASQLTYPSTKHHKTPVSAQVVDHRVIVVRSSRVHTWVAHKNNVESAELFAHIMPRFYCDYCDAAVTNSTVRASQNSCIDAPHWFARRRFGLGSNTTTGSTTAKLGGNTTARSAPLCSIAALVLCHVDFCVRSSLETHGTTPRSSTPVLRRRARLGTLPWGISRHPTPAVRSFLEFPTPVGLCHPWPVLSAQARTRLACRGLIIE